MIDRAETRVLLVGEVNPFGGNPRMALFYHPRTSSGNRARLILGLSDGDYVRYCGRVNLCVGRFELGAARVAAATLLSSRTELVFVLLGLRVRQSFFVPRLYEPSVRAGKTLVAVPHPSGRCRAWNDPSVASRVRDLLRELVPDVPWGAATSTETGDADGNLKVDT